MILALMCDFHKKNMKESFLEYTKYILDKVSFDKDLLTKEYFKSLKLLQLEEINQLNTWIQGKGLQLQPILV